MSSILVIDNDPITLRHTHESRECEGYQRFAGRVAALMRCGNCIDWRC